MPSGFSLYDDIPSKQDPSVNPAPQPATATSSLYDDINSVEETSKKTLKSQTSDRGDTNKRKLADEGKNDCAKRQKTGKVIFSIFFITRARRIDKGYSRKKYLGGEDGRRYIFLWVVGAHIFQIIWVLGV